MMMVGQREMLIGVDEYNIVMKAKVTTVSQILNMTDEISCSDVYAFLSC